MTKYGGPKRLTGRLRDGYTVRFLRVGNLVSIGKPNDLDVPYQTLAVAEKIGPFVAEFRETNPKEVDAGELRIEHDRANGGEIVVLGISADYDLPVPRSGARQRTGEIIRRLSPRYEVTTDVDPITPGGKERK